MAPSGRPAALSAAPSWFSAALMSSTSSWSELLVDVLAAGTVTVIVPLPRSMPVAKLPLPSFLYRRFAWLALP
jgi:hypothetical protein